MGGDLLVDQAAGLSSGSYHGGHAEDAEPALLDIQVERPFQRCDCEYMFVNSSASQSSVCVRGSSLVGYKPYRVQPTQPGAVHVWQLAGCHVCLLRSLMSRIP